MDLKKSVGVWTDPTDLDFSLCSNRKALDQLNNYWRKTQL